MLTNVIVPWAMAEKHLAVAPDWLPAEDICNDVRVMAYRLFGRDHNPNAVYASNAVLVQGLIYLYRDCRERFPDCTQCPGVIMKKRGPR